MKSTPIPPPLPSKLPPSQRPLSELDSIDNEFSKLYDEESDEGAKFRAYMNTTDSVDSVSGDFDLDRGFAAQMLKNRAIDNGAIVVANLKVKAIANKFEHVLRRRDTPETPFSLAARMKQITDQREPQPEEETTETADEFTGE